MMDQNRLDEMKIRGATTACDIQELVAEVEMLRRLVPGASNQCCDHRVTNLTWDVKLDLDKSRFPAVIAGPPEFTLKATGRGGHIHGAIQAIIDHIASVEARDLGGKSIDPPASRSPEWIATQVVNHIDQTNMHADPRRPADNPNRVYVPNAGWLWQRIVDVLSEKPRKDWRY